MRSPSSRRPPRVAPLLVLAAIAVLLALVQRTPVAPLPHAADGFLDGLAFGLGVSAVLAWLSGR